MGGCCCGGEEVSGGAGGTGASVCWRNGVPRLGEGGLVRGAVDLGVEDEEERVDDERAEVLPEEDLYVGMRGGAQSER